MRTLETRLGVASAVIISLILYGAFFSIEMIVEPHVQMPVLASVRAQLVGTGIITCFLLLVTNYLLIRIAVRRAAGPKAVDVAPQTRDAQPDRDPS
jgi:hypothetical protein